MIFLTNFVRKEIIIEFSKIIEWIAWTFYAGGLEISFWVLIFYILIYIDMKKYV